MSSVIRSISLASIAFQIGSKSNLEVEISPLGMSNFMAGKFEEDFDWWAQNSSPEFWKKILCWCMKNIMSLVCRRFGANHLLHLLSYSIIALYANVWRKTFLSLWTIWLLVIPNDSGKILLKWFPQAGVEQFPPFRCLLGMIHFEYTLVPQMNRVIHLHDKSSATCRCPHRSGIINGRKCGMKQTLYNCRT